MWISHPLNSAKVAKKKHKNYIKYSYIIFICSYTAFVVTNVSHLCASKQC